VTEATIHLPPCVEDAGRVAEQNSPHFLLRIMGDTFHCPWQSRSGSNISREKDLFLVESVSSENCRSHPSTLSSRKIHSNSVNSWSGTSASCACVHAHSYIPPAGGVLGGHPGKRSNAFPFPHPTSYLLTHNAEILHGHRFEQA
jgi:hypothetical protein